MRKCLYQILNCTDDRKVITVFWLWDWHAFFKTALVCAEKCFDSSECSHMTCDTGYDVACTSHVCTCEMSGGGGGHGHTGYLKTRFFLFLFYCF